MVAAKCQVEIQLRKLAQPIASKLINKVFLGSQKVGVKDAVL
jgi:hypothetical protein